MNRQQQSEPQSQQEIASRQRVIRIGNGAGFWGDSLDAPQQLLAASQDDPLDYLTLEYLAELTMSILAHQRSRRADAGYVTDFPVVLESLLPFLRTDKSAVQTGLRIVTNAGGMNPTGCAKQVAKLLTENGCGHLKIAAVAGDDLLPELDRHIADGELFANIETSEPLGARRERTVCANAYLGAEGIVSALQTGADIVITGRVADASLVVGPAVHEFGWSWDDADRLAGATVAGHLIECGAQVTGGMFSDWTEQISLGDVGYPIVEISADGDCVITKPNGSGGQVSVGTVSEQLVYEIGDPQRYFTPDVVADFSQVTLQQQNESQQNTSQSESQNKSQTEQQRVSVSGAKGTPRPDRYKVSLAYTDGYRAAGTLVIAGRNAVKKAGVCADAIRQRLQRANCLPERWHVECLGAGDSLPGIWSQHFSTHDFSTHDFSIQNFSTHNTEPWDVVLRVAAHDPSREIIERFSRELTPLVTSGPPGVTGYTGARPRPVPVLSYWPTTISREQMAATVNVQTAEAWL